MVVEGAGMAISADIPGAELHMSSGKVAVKVRKHLHPTEENL